MLTLRFRFVVPHHRLVLIRITGFRSFLGDVSWNSISCLSLSEAADEVTDWIQIGMDLFIPSRTYQVKSHSQPWFTPACAAVISHRNHYFHQFHRDGSREAHHQFRLAMNNCKKVLENAKRNYAESVQESISTQRLGCRDFLRIANP